MVGIEFLEGYAGHMILLLMFPPNAAVPAEQQRQFYMRPLVRRPPRPPSLDHKTTLVAHGSRLDPYHHAGRKHKRRPRTGFATLGAPSSGAWYARFVAGVGSGGADRLAIGLPCVSNEQVSHEWLGVFNEKLVLGK